MKKLISIALCIALCAVLFVTSCSSSSGKAVMTLDSAKVGEAEYLYWMSTYKARYLSAYTDIKDTAEYWGQKISTDSDTTNEDLVNDLIRQNIKSNLVSMALFAECGLTVSDDEKAEVDEYIQGLIDELADGSRKVLNASLAEFGVNIDLLRTIFINEQKTVDVYDYFYGENGKTPVTDTDRERYYTENYVRFMQINVNDAYTYEENEDGTYIQDTQGNYQTRDLTEDEAKEKAEKIAEIDSLIADGKELSELYEEYSEHTAYPNGYYFSSLTASNYIGEIITKAFTLKEGEITKIESAEYGTFFIQRLPLDEGAYSAEENADFFDGFDDTVAQDLFDEMVTGKFEEIVVDEELLNALSVADVAANYYYY